jgi:hypothetical protein
MPINSIGPTISRAKNKLKILIQNESKTWSKN